MERSKEMLLDKQNPLCKAGSFNQRQGSSFYGMKSKKSQVLAWISPHRAHLQTPRAEGSIPPVALEVD